jgi:outer membrane protein assembly factor BamA
MRFFIVIAFLLLVFSTSGYAQSDTSTRRIVDSGTVSIDSVVETTRYPQLDLGDVVRSILKKKNTDSLKPPPKPVKYHFSIVPAIGYTLSTGVAAILATNVAFFTDDPLRTNVSNVAVQLVYSQYNQLTIPVIANIWTRDNNYNIAVDWRYYKYPQDTYGLGGHSSLDDANRIDYQHFRMHQSILKKISPSIYAGVGYFLDYHWDIHEGGQSNGEVSDAKKYGLPEKTVSSGPVFNFLFDNRKNAINPQGGLYANILYRPNLTVFGSDANWQSLTIDIRKYFHLPAGSQNILAFWNYDWLTPSGKPPYLDLPATGWDTYNNTGRGYIQGRFRSLNMLYLETEYRFVITRNGLFGGVLFANAQSFSNYPGNGLDMLWPAFGGGLRIKVNKHSNTNIAVDYGIGIDGSKGFFVNLGEVF